MTSRQLGYGCHSTRESASTGAATGWRGPTTPRSIACLAFIVTVLAAGIPAWSSEPEAAADTVYVTPNPSFYHRHDCRRLARPRPLSLEQAVARGLEPCDDCRPHEAVVEPAAPVPPAATPPAPRPAAPMPQAPPGKPEPPRAPTSAREPRAVRAPGMLPPVAQPGRRDSGLLYGYGASGVVGSVAAFQAGAGYETPSLEGLRVGFEFGYLAPFRAVDYGIFVLSFNGVYHLSGPPRPRAWGPFVTGGYSLGFRSSTVNLFNFGGGADYWLSESTGLRIEFRDHVRFGDSYSGDTHFWGMRFAYVKRLGDW